MCVPDMAPPLSELPLTVVGPAGLITRSGTLKSDPFYYGDRSPRKSHGQSANRISFSGSADSERRALARWLASCGCSAEEIVDSFSVESLGVRRRSVKVATVRRWAGRELLQYKELKAAVLASELVQATRQLRAGDVPAIIRRIEALRAEYHHSGGHWRRIALDECDKQLARIRVKACARCEEPFLAKRDDARYCGAACRKAANRANVTDKQAILKTASQVGRTTMIATDEQLALDAERLAEIAHELFTTAARLQARFPTNDILNATVDRFIQAALESSTSLPRAA